MENLYVGDLSYFCTTEHLRKVFEPYGPLESAGVRYSQRKGTTLHYGFVTLSASKAQKAIDELNKKIFMGRRLRVTYCTRMADEHENNPSGVSIHLSFLSHLNSTVVNEEYLREIFEPFGGLVDVVVKCWTNETASNNSTSRKQYGYAFFLMENQDVAQKLLQKLDTVHRNCLKNVRYDGKITTTLQKAENAPKINPQIILHTKPLVSESVPLMTISNNNQVPSYPGIITPAGKISTPTSVSSIKSTATDGATYMASTADANHAFCPPNTTNQPKNHPTTPSASHVEHHQPMPVYHPVPFVNNNTMDYTYSASAPAQISHLPHPPSQHHLPPFPHTFAHKHSQDLNNLTMIQNLFYAQPSMNIIKEVMGMRVPVSNNLAPHPTQYLQVHFGTTPAQPFLLFPPPSHLPHPVLVPTQLAQQEFQYVGMQPMVSSPPSGTQHFISLSAVPSSMIMH